VSEGPRVTTWGVTAGVTAPFCLHEDGGRNVGVDALTRIGWRKQQCRRSKSRRFPGGLESWRQNYVFLDMSFSQRGAACLLPMSSGAGSVVLRVLTEGRARMPSVPELSSDRLVPVHDRGSPTKIA
jgi:hypothetical protein